MFEISAKNGSGVRGISISVRRMKATQKEEGSRERSGKRENNQEGSKQIPGRENGCPLATTTQETSSEVQTSGKCMIDSGKERGRGPLEKN